MEETCWHIKYIVEESNNNGMLLPWFGKCVLYLRHAMTMTLMWFYTVSAII